MDNFYMELFLTIFFFFFFEFIWKKSRGEWIRYNKHFIENFSLRQKRSKRKKKLTKGKATTGNVRKEVSRKHSFVNKEEKDTST